jgi:hypothetical protein
MFAGALSLAALLSGATAVGVNFVRTDDFDFAKVVPAPPAPGSVAAAADLDAVLQAQAWRTPEQVDWAKRVAAGDVFVFSEAIGASFNAKNLPETAALLRGVDSDLDGAINASKRVFARPRPFAADPRVHPCVSRSHGASYPSGHAIRFFVEAGVLSEIFPERRAQILEYAHRLAWGRVIGGVHYPTDLAGGEVLAQAILERLEASAAFQAALGRSRAEVAAFGAAKVGDLLRAAGLELCPAGA